LEQLPQPGGHLSYPLGTHNIIRLLFQTRIKWDAKEY
jgi:hypothetical protein